MPDASGNSLRLLFDLQACQTPGSATRGVGRYSRALFGAIARRSPPRDLHVLISESLPHVVDSDPLPPSRVHRLPRLPDWGSSPDPQGGGEDTLDGVAYAAVAQTLLPDVIHVSHIFEGLGERVPLPSTALRTPGQVLSATLYDLIPLRFPGHYFRDARFRRWYHSRLAFLRAADLLLSISEASRRDAIELLGLDPGRIATIHGGIGPHFRPPEDREAARRSVAERHGIRGRFALYLAGDEYRKNLEGALRGWAEVPEPARRGVTFVIVCAMRPERRLELLDLARDSGLSAEDVILAGHVPEEELVLLYGACDLFLFPSLYEGLGLPVLEAMACGAPVVASDSSSLPELVGRTDALFDAASPASIARRVANALESEGFRDDLRGHGLLRAREYTWERSADLALEAIDAAVALKREDGVRAAAAGWLPRKRLAVVTPLPPSRSGIADYDAEFLPHLARHFELDVYVDATAVDDLRLLPTPRVYHAKDFAAVAHSYDAILYEFGNSEFHAHMLPLLEDYPGVVGLHDAYLSGLFGYLEFHAGQTGRYAGSMLEAHGPRARRIFAPARGEADPNARAMVELPCTKWVLDRAIGVISHSPFNLAVARREYPEGWAAPYRTIPQMVSRPVPIVAERRATVRRELGIAADEFVIATFGFVAWTKWGDRLLGAFLDSTLRDDPRVRLVFAGQLAKDDFGVNLRHSISGSGIEPRIRVTGWLSNEDYEKHLIAADLAVQLRTKSRGGTPRGVLDCLARGVPVIVNRGASYVDYPEDVVIGIAADPAVGEIARALEAARREPERLRRIAAAGIEYLGREHDPASCAAQYAAAIHEFAERRALTRPEQLAAAAAPFLESCSDPSRAAAIAAEWLGRVPRPAFSRWRVLIDVSHIAAFDERSGIQRVVRETVAALLCTDRGGVDPIAVELADGELRVAAAWIAQHGLAVGHPPRGGPAERIRVRRGDILLMLDSSWGRWREFSAIFAEAERHEVPILTAIYDLLPISFPEAFPTGGTVGFGDWFDEAARRSDGLVCISRAVASEVAARIGGGLPGERGSGVAHWRLGSDFAGTQAPAERTSRVTAALSRPALLIVGTIEPRKRHALALAAMERLWGEGREVALIIAGKKGWIVEDLVARLRAHPEAGGRLHWVEGASDGELRALYEGAAGLLFLSRGEGFGLPLVEAGAHGLPILCSRLPVFAEVAGEHATYLDSEDPEGLAGEISAWLEGRSRGTVPDSRRIPRLTWEESADELLSVVLDPSWRRKSARHVLS